MAKIIHFPMGSNGNIVNRRGKHTEATTRREMIAMDKSGKKSNILTIKNF